MASLRPEASSGRSHTEARDSHPRQLSPHISVIETDKLASEGSINVNSVARHAARAYMTGCKGVAHRCHACTSHRVNIVYFLR